MVEMRKHVKAAGKEEVVQKLQVVRRLLVVRRPRWPAGMEVVGGAWLDFCWG